VRAINSCLIVAFLIACGNPTESGSAGPGQLNLKITTVGDGVVRGAGNECRGTCNAQFGNGAQVQLQAVPDSGALFAGWSGACTGAGACQLTLTHDVAVVATFLRQAPATGLHRLTVVVEGAGRVASTPAGIDCDSTTCGGDFADGTAVALTATAAATSTFAGWGGGACSGPGACSVTLRSDVQVFAHFDAKAPQQVHLVAGVSGPGRVTGGGIACGSNGAATCDVALAPGTSVTLTAAADPQARFMGWGGACNGTTATCQLTVQTNTQVTAEFQHEVETLVPADGTNLTLIALNSTQVFFVRRNFDGTQSAWSVPKTGGAAVQIVPSGFFSYMVADDGFLYWSSGNSLSSVPAGGGSASLLAGGFPVGRLALDSDGALYWVRPGPDSDGSIHRMQNRVDKVLATGQGANGGIAVDATHAYFTTLAFSGGARSIRRVAKTGGAVEVLISPTGSPISTRVDSQNVYYQESSGAVWSWSKSGGTPRLLSSANGSQGFANNAIDLEVNASVVWWMWVDLTGRTPSGLFNARPDGTDFTTVDASSDVQWSGPRVDDTAAYYFHGGALLRRLK
jgi:Divergent InlB B-repeat domain